MTKEKNNKCIFCNRERIKEDILGETKNFFIKVGFGLTSPGHVIIISKEHYSCIATLPKNLYEEFIEVKERTKEIIAKKFSESFLEEFSPPFQSVSHAHVHLIPLESSYPKYKIKNLIEEMDIPKYIKVEEGDIDDLRKVWRDESSYVSIEQNTKLYIVHTKGLTPEKAVPILGYRFFLKFKKGVDMPVYWNNMTPKETKEDEKKREITKDKLRLDFKKLF